MQTAQAKDGGGGQPPECILGGGRAGSGEGGATHDEIAHAAWALALKYGRAMAKHVPNGRLSRIRETLCDQMRVALGGPTTPLAEEVLEKVVGEQEVGLVAICRYFQIPRTRAQAKISPEASTVNVVSMPSLVSMAATQ